MKRKVVRFVKRTMFVLGAVCVISWSLVIGYHYAKSTVMPETVYAEKKVEVPVEQLTPVMKRIAKCESGDIHKDPVTGQVYTKANKNGTVDIGKYMINEHYWGKKATQLGFDLTNEKDNEKMAMWIYQNRGTADWNASQSCWSK